MAESAFQTGEVRFPKTGGTWTPLPNDTSGNKVRSHAVQTINATPEQIFNVYSRIELLPTWQEGVVSVEETGANTLHWKMEDPGTRAPVEFDSEILEAEQGKRHVSRITSGPSAGSTVILSLEPHPAGRGTMATMITDATVPGGWLTNAITAVVSRRPQQITTENLRHLKELIESGEIPTVEGQPAGRRGISGKLKQILLGENMPTPPGTRENARPEDMPTRNLLGSTPSKTLTTIGLIALPILVGTVIWASVSGDD